MLPLLTIILPSDATETPGGGGDALFPEDELDMTVVNAGTATTAAPDDVSYSDFGEQPSVEETSSVGGWVWIVMFGFVMSLSLAANLVLTLGVASNRRTRSEPVYLLLLTMFLVNVADYSLLSFEFSLGVEHVFPYSEPSCAAYQVALRSMPILEAIAVTVLVYYTAAKFLVPRNPNAVRRLWIAPPFYREVPTSSNLGSESTGSGGAPTGSFCTFAILAGVMATACGALAVPTAYFARIVSFEGKGYCEIDLSPLVDVTSGGSAALQTAVSVYYLAYSAVLSYWLPLFISLPAMIRLYRSRAGKSPEVSVALSASVSFFVFFALHAAVVAARHTIDAADIPISTYQSWMLKVIQSLFWLVAYFWHFSRAALALLLDPDLKEWAMRPTVSNCLCCGARSSSADDDAPSGGGAAATGDDPESNGSLVPLCYVMEVKTGLGAADHGEEDKC